MSGDSNRQNRLIGLLKKLGQQPLVQNLLNEVRKVESLGGSTAFLKNLDWLLLFIPISLLFDCLNVNPLVLFITACLAIIPLAALLGEITEQISAYTGPKAGGVLNATMGNIPELFIGIFAVLANLYSLALASILGSIIGNMLLVLGGSFFFGGIKYKQQKINHLLYSTNFCGLFFFLFCLTMVAGYGYHREVLPHTSTLLSMGSSLLLIGLYAASQYLTLVTHKEFLEPNFPESGELQEEELTFAEEGAERPALSLRKALCFLSIIALFLAIESHILVGSVEAVVHLLGWSEIFLGIIVVPIVGNVAEQSAAIIMAWKNKIDISVEIATGSATQISLFVGPVLVLVGLLSGHPFTYLFSPFETITCVGALMLAYIVTGNGITNWFKGLMLIAGYLFLGFLYFFV